MISVTILMFYIVIAASDDPCNWSNNIATCIVPYDCLPPLKWSIDPQGVDRDGTHLIYCGLIGSSIPKECWKGNLEETQKNAAVNGLLRSAKALEDQYNFDIDIPNGALRQYYLDPIDLEAYAFNGIVQVNQQSQYELLDKYSFTIETLTSGIWKRAIGSLSSMGKEITPGNYISVITSIFNSEDAIRQANFDYSIAKMALQRALHKAEYDHIGNQLDILQKYLHKVCNYRNRKMLQNNNNSFVDDMNNTLINNDTTSIRGLTSFLYIRAVKNEYINKHINNITNISSLQVTTPSLILQNDTIVNTVDTIPLHCGFRCVGNNAYNSFSNNILSNKSAEQFINMFEINSLTANCRSTYSPNTTLTNTYCRFCNQDSIHNEVAYVYMLQYIISSMGKTNMYAAKDSLTLATMSKLQNWNKMTYAINDYLIALKNKVCNII